MAANSKITGVVEYRVGDGPMLEIPLGPCEVELADDSAVISWDEDGEAMRTAIPLADYERYAKEGKIERPST